MIFNKKKETEAIEVTDNALVNKVTFDGTLTRGVVETKNTQGLYTVKVKGVVNDTACEIPVYIKTFFVKEDFEDVGLYSSVRVQGHLEFPMLKNMTTKLIFVADKVERL